ncbi:MAG TPA: hypothetical protein VK174_09725, partial [Chitinophagales bacterium]|nr:hypothetical protein [Chitinophagales bacterium]
MSAMLFITRTTIKSATNGLLLFFLLLLAVGYNNDLQAATKTSAATGNWSAAATWSPSGVPAPGDDVIIRGGHVVTVNGAYTCNNLDLGDATSGTTTLTVTVGNSLTINGAVRINPNNTASTYTLDAGAGTINMNGTFTSWSTSGTNSIRVSTGTFNITPAITINAATQNVTFTGAGTINFRNAFTDRYNKLVTFASCVVNFFNNYTVNTTAASWAAKGTAVFKGSASVVTATTNLTLFNVQVDTNMTLASAAGSVVVGGNVVLSSGSVFTANKDFEIQGNWTNNGGTLSGGSNTVSFSGSTKTIGGTAGTTFPNLQIGVAASTASVTMSRHNRCSNFTINGVAAARTFTLTTGDSLAISGNLTINQATSNVTNQLAVNGGICTVGGNLVFAGTDNTATRIGRVGVTSGVFRVAGAVTWMSNTVIATEVITVATGSIVFDSPVTMGSASATLSVTGAGSIYFNGTSATSFTFGGATAPSFSTASASNVYFAKGFTNSTNALTFNAASNTYLSGNGTITPTAAITFGNLLTSASAVDTIATGAAVIVAGNATLASGSVLVLGQNLQLNGNWTNNGGTLNGGSNTVILNGATKTIGGTSATAFPNLQLGAAASNGTYTVNSNISCNNFTFHSAANLRTLTISVGNTVAIGGNLTINQGTSAVTNTLAVNAGACTVAGNLVFSGTNNGSYITRVVVTTGSFSVAGTVTWASNTAVTTEVISATTGTLTFGSPLTMGSGSGTLTVSGAGNIYFNGNTSTSFTFGGAATVPVFTTAAGCNLYFARGFTNNTNALTLNATSTATFTGNGTIAPNAAITFGHVTIDPSEYDTLSSAAGAVIIKGDLTIGSGALFKANKDFEVAGNWTNNGGTFDGGTYTVIINGLTKTIGGTSATTFYNLQIGNTAVILNYTANKNITCNNLVFNGITTARTLTLSTGVTLTINGSLTMNQPTGAVVNTLAVGAGTCTVAGNLVFAGTSNTATRIAKVQVTSGAFTLNGSITWMSNTSSATEVITTATGTVTLANSVTMGSGSGTISVTGAGIINFNGSSAPCLAF